VRWTGQGKDLWRVRVDLFAASTSPGLVSGTFDRLRALLTEGDGGEQDLVGADQGLGITQRPVVGLLFWVRADDEGSAATTAVAAARAAGSGGGVGPELYDVTVIPQEAVVLPGDPLYPTQPD
jgi:hypothetical protein